MKKITKPELKSAVRMKPAEMNRIHFGGNHTPLTPKELLGVHCDKTGESNPGV